MSRFASLLTAQSGGPSIARRGFLSPADVQPRASAPDTQGDELLAQVWDYLNRNRMEPTEENMRHALGAVTGQEASPEQLSDTLRQGGVTMPLAAPRRQGRPEIPAMQSGPLRGKQLSLPPNPPPGNPMDLIDEAPNLANRRQAPFPPQRDDGVNGAPAHDDKQQRLSQALQMGDDELTEKIMMWMDRNGVQSSDAGILQGVEAITGVQMTREEFGRYIFERVPFAEIMRARGAQ